MKKSDFDEHQVFEKFKTVKEILQRGVENEGYGEAVNADIQEVIDKVEYVEWAVKNSDSALLSEAKLNELINCLNTILKQGFTEKVTQNGIRITRLNLNIRNGSEVLIKNFPFPIAKKYFKSESAKIVDEFKKSTEHKISELKNNAQAAIEIIQGEQENFSEYSQHKTAKLKLELNDIENKLTARNKEIEDLRQKISDNTAAINAAAEEKARQFDELIDQRKKQLEYWGEETKSLGDDFLKKIKEIYQMSANIGLSGEFVAVARKENTVYWVWSIASIFLFFLAFFITLNAWGISGALFNLGEEGSNVSLSILEESTTSFFLKRLGISLPLLLLAGTLMSFAASHRKTSRAYRIMGTRIKTLKAFVLEFGNDENKLDEEQLKALTEHFFTSDMNPKPTKEKGATNLALNKLIDIIKGLIEKVH